MNIERSARLAICAAFPLVMLAGCADKSIFEAPGDASFGEANRQTMMAQVVNPDPVYTDELVTSGEHAADAVQRYREDAVKQPESIRTTDVGEGGEGPN